MDPKEANAKWGIPTSAIIGMAIVESGYGTTRIAVNANNLLGIKVWVTSPSHGWQLKGQPDENNGTVPVLANYGKDRIIYDEKKFKDIQGHWAKKEIEFLAENGWISGHTDGTFKPDNNLTRAQAAQIISNLSFLLFYI